MRVGSGHCRRDRRGNVRNPRARWRRTLRRNGPRRQSRWAVAGLGVCITVLVAVAAAIDSDPVVGLLALALLAGTVTMDRWCLRRVRQADDLLDSLDA